MFNGPSLNLKVDIEKVEYLDFSRLFFKETMNLNYRHGFFEDFFKT